jgi:glycosyltransferase involved in cell wall biosynthesis
MGVQVSIIVPCYKQAHFLNESLQSVLSQVYTNWECIIVNDGSPDNTETVAQQWCARDSRFKYLKKENGGLSSARNAGIAISKGEYILPLDTDDVLHGDYLEKLIPVLSNDESLGIVSCYTKFFSTNIKATTFDLIPQGTNWRYLLYVNQLIATSLYRKECWEIVGGYDESMNKGFEDWEFWINISKRDWNYEIIPEFLFYYRKSKQSMLTATIQNHAEEVKCYIFTKHKELYIIDFDNCMEVLFYELSVQKQGYDSVKNSLGYKIERLIAKPFSVISKLFSIQK